jgi:hypothetical protein
MSAIPAATAPVLAVSVPDAARTIGTSRSKLYTLFNEGAIAWVQVGRRRVVEIKELERFLAAHRVKRDSACKGAMADPAEEPPPTTIDADRGQLHQPAARRSRACRTGQKAGESSA